MLYSLTGRQVLSINGKNPKVGTLYDPFHFLIHHLNVFGDYMALKTILRQSTIGRRVLKWLFSSGKVLYLCCSSEHQNLSHKWYTYTCPGVYLGQDEISWSISCQFIGTLWEHFVRKTIQKEPSSRGKAHSPHALSQCQAVILWWFIGNLWQYFASVRALKAMK